MRNEQAAPPKVSDFLKATVRHVDGLTQERLAEALDVSRHTVNELFNDRRSVTPLMALKLAYVLDTDPEFWLNVQKAFDLFQAQELFKHERPKLKVMRKGSLAVQSERRAAG